MIPPETGEGGSRVAQCSLDAWTAKEGHMPFWRGLLAVRLTVKGHGTVYVECWDPFISHGMGVT